VCIANWPRKVSQIYLLLLLRRQLLSETWPIISGASIKFKESVYRNELNNVARSEPSCSMGNFRSFYGTDSCGIPSSFARDELGKISSK